MHLDEMSVTAVMYGLTILCFIPVCIFTAAGETGALLRWISVILLAFIMMATTGANTMLMTFIPLRYKRIGKVSSISGMLNAFSYAGAHVLVSLLVWFLNTADGALQFYLLLLFRSWAPLYLYFVFGFGEEKCRLCNRLCQRFFSFFKKAV